MQYRRKIHIYQFLSYLIHIILGSSGILFLVKTRYQNILMLLFAFLVFLFFLHWKFKVLISKNEYLFLLFLTGHVVSALYNADVPLLIKTVVYAVLFFWCIQILPNYFLEINAKTHRDAIFLVIKFLCMLCILPGYKNTSWGRGYSGIFANPNSLGITEAVLYMLCFADISIIIKDRLLYGKKIFNKSLVFNGVGMLFSAYFCIMCASRTATLAISLVTVTGMCLMIGYGFGQKIKINYLKRALKLLCVILFIALFMAIVSGLADIFYDIIISKFRATSGDIFQTRTTAWYKIWIEQELFGHPRSYLEQLKIGSHNTYFYLLASNGTVVALIFLLLNIQIILTGIRCFFKYEMDDYAIYAIYSVVLFNLMSMTEAMLFTLAMLVMFITYGMLIYRNKYLIKIEKEKAVRWTEQTYYNS